MHICTLCGKEEANSYNDRTKKRLTDNQHCFGCDFWLDKIKIKDDPKVARIKGSHYYIGNQTISDRWNGFGGGTFHIEFSDGRSVKTCDLWSQGSIPSHFRKQLPDNARFADDCPGGKIVRST